MLLTASKNGVVPLTRPWCSLPSTPSYMPRAGFFKTSISLVRGCSHGRSSRTHALRRSFAPRLFGGAAVRRKADLNGIRSALADDWDTSGVYIGGLPFTEPPTVNYRPILQTCMSLVAFTCSRPSGADETICDVPLEILVSTIDKSKSRKRDIGKLNRGFAYACFKSSNAADAAALALQGLDMRGRAVTTSRSVEGLKKHFDSQVNTGSTNENHAQVQVPEQELVARRAHKRRNRQRQRAQIRADQEAVLARLVPDYGADSHREEAIESDEVTTEEPEVWHKYYSRWKDPSAAADTLGRIDWASMPAAVDPARGGGLGVDSEGEATWRARRKHLQVESFLAVLASSGAVRPGARFVDFGSGSGNLTLPLAYLMPECSFVAVDVKAVAVDLLRERAREAGLANVRAVCGSIEEFETEFDVCLALHVCGSGTDMSMIKAIEQRASYFVSPCCIGKLQASAGLVDPHKDAESTGLRLVHPRSRWMRELVGRDEFVSLAAAADYSGHTGVSGYDASTPQGRVPRFAKAALEADRNASSREHEYSTRLMKLLHPEACVRNDLLIGYPQEHGFETKYITSAYEEWGESCITKDL